MMTFAEKLAVLQAAYPDATAWQEGGVEIVHLPTLKFLSNGQLVTLEAILWPHARDGYQSRLFLRSSIQGKGNNWNAFSICGSTWYACSWQGVPNNLPFAEMLLSHVSVLT